MGTPTRQTSIERAAGLALLGIRTPTSGLRPLLLVGVVGERGEEDGRVRPTNSCCCTKPPCRPPDAYFPKTPPCPHTIPRTVSGPGTFPASLASQTAGASPKARGRGRRRVQRRPRHVTDPSVASESGLGTHPAARGRPRPGSGHRGADSGPRWPSEGRGGAPGPPESRPPQLPARKERRGELYRFFLALAFSLDPGRALGPAAAPIRRPVLTDWVDFTHRHTQARALRAWRRAFTAGPSSPNRSTRPQQPLKARSPSKSHSRSQASGG